MSKNKNYLLLKNRNQKDLKDNTKLRNGIYVDFTINVESVNNISMNSVAGNELLKQLLYTYGPIFVSIDTNLLKFHPSLYSFEMATIGILSTRHALILPTLAVLLVGYGTIPETKKQYWILKNSWSNTWGRDGYFAIEFVTEPLPEKNNEQNKKVGPAALFDDITFMSTKNMKLLRIDKSIYEKYGINPKKYEINLCDVFTDNVEKVRKVEKKIYGTGYKKLEKSYKATVIGAESITDRNLKVIPKEFEKFYSYTHSCHNRYGLALSGPVFNQGLCGSDWVMAGCQLLSAVMAIHYLQVYKKKLIVPLSPQYILYRTCEFRPSHFVEGSNPCSGGNITLFTVAINGISLDWDYPISASRGEVFDSVVSFESFPYMLEGGNCRKCKEEYGNNSRVCKNCCNYCEGCASLKSFPPSVIQSVTKRPTFHEIRPPTCKKNLLCGNSQRKLSPRPTPKLQVNLLKEKNDKDYENIIDKMETQLKNQKNTLNELKKDLNVENYTTTENHKNKKSIPWFWIYVLIFVVVTILIFLKI